LPLREISEWKADHIRLVLFSDSAWEAAAEGIFQEVFGDAPAESSLKRGIGESSATGTALGGRATIVRTINRLDFVLQGPLVEGEIMSLLDTVDLCLDRLLVAISGWAVTQLQPIVRVAVNGRMLLPTSSTAESYLRLSELIQVIEVDAARFRDFQFQVNLPEQSSVVNGLAINHLTAWGSLVVGAELMQPGGAQQPALMQHFCSCITDINSDRENTKRMQPNEITAVLAECVEATKSVLLNGIA
jgi:hypothetical protein